MYIPWDTADEAQCQDKSSPACFSRPQSTTLHLWQSTNTRTHAEKKKKHFAHKSRTDPFHQSVAKFKVAAAIYLFPLRLLLRLFLRRSSHTSCLGGPYVGKQMPQHSMQISRQSDDSQQASMMPQSMSQGPLQSSPRSSAPQQQQQQASAPQASQEACAATMLHSARNSQNRQARMQWTQQSGVKVNEKILKKEKKSYFFNWFQSKRKQLQRRWQIFAEESWYCLLVAVTGRKKKYAKLWTWDPEEKKNIQRSALQPHPPHSPSVLINGLLNNCSIIMQTARLITQETISHKSKRLSR